MPNKIKVTIKAKQDEALLDSWVDDEVLENEAKTEQLPEETEAECRKNKGDFCYMHPKREPAPTKPKKIEMKEKSGAKSND